MKNLAAKITLAIQKTELLLISPQILWHKFGGIGIPLSKEFIDPSNMKIAGAIKAFFQQPFRSLQLPNQN